MVRIAVFLRVLMLLCWSCSAALSIAGCLWCRCQKLCVGGKVWCDDPSDPVGSKNKRGGENKEQSKKWGRGTAALVAESRL